MIARTLGFIWTGKNHRHVISRSNSLNRIGDILHTFAKILASMAGYADDTLALEPLLKVCQTGGKRGFLLDLTRYPFEGVDHGVASNMDRGRIDILSYQRVRTGLRRCAVEFSERAHHAAVHLFGPRLVDIPAA